MKKNYFFTLLLTICMSALSFGQDLIITGAFDGPNTGGTPKGVELYVINDISDLSIYGVGSANNGGGTDGEEFTFPAVAVVAGTFLYVASETEQFEVFFGFAPTYTSGAMAINGDDAIELFKNDAVVETFGDISTDGTGEAWDHLDGWAYRVSGTVSNGTFVIADWSFSGINQLEGGTTNNSTTSPFPVGSYTSATASLKNNAIKGFATYPNPVTNKEFTISSSSNSVKEIAIFNVIGKKVLTTRFSGFKSTIDVAAIGSGIYILKVMEAGKISTKKLVIR
jgi:hypothetical protein